MIYPRNFAFFITVQILALKQRPDFVRISKIGIGEHNEDYEDEAEVHTVGIVQRIDGYRVGKNIHGCFNSDNVVQWI